MADITYNTLYNTFLSWIKTNCNNIDSYTAAVPDSAKSGYIKDIKNDAGEGISYSVDNSSIVPVISHSTIENELNDYFTSVGIIDKLSMKATTNGLINFWNAAATFCAGKLVFVSGQWIDSPILMYASKTIPSNTITTLNDEIITASTVDSILDSFNNVILIHTRAHKINYTISATSSSCSSSSCSSSSSSCSSSSSVFIGYIKI